MKTILPLAICITIIMHLIIFGVYLFFRLRVFGEAVFETGFGLITRMIRGFTTSKIEDFEQIRNFTLNWTLAKKRFLKFFFVRLWIRICIILKSFILSKCPKFLKFFSVKVLPVDLLGLSEKSNFHKTLDFCAIFLLTREHEWANGLTMTWTRIRKMFSCSLKIGN